MKKILKITIFLLFLILIGLWSPWRAVEVDIADIFSVESPDPISGLQVHSLVGELEVFIEGVQAESTVESGEEPLSVVAIAPGEKGIIIQRKTPEGVNYWKYNEVLKFVQGTDVIISLGLGPSEEYTEGSIITATEKGDEEENLRVSIDEKDATVTLNGVQTKVDGNSFEGSIPLTKQSTLKIEKAGYDTLEFKILPEEQIERDKLANYKMNVEVMLLLQPVNIE